MNIYIDAMGGDNAPEAIVQGCVDAVHAYGQELFLIGDEAKISKIFSEQQLSQEKINIIHASEVISMDEEPALAVKRKKNSSLAVGARSVKENPGSVLVSAGSTGALLSAAILYTGRIKGIMRPALGIALPGKDPVMLIDGGANADCKPEYFPQFAFMGQIYMENILGVQSPTVGLVNIGAEEKKGSALYKESHELLKEKTENFIGNVESRYLMEHPADVLVCDGFTGNVILKLLEGMNSFFLGNMKEVFKSSVKNKMAFLAIKKDFKSQLSLLDYKKHGGAPLLGINGGIIKAHGSSNRETFKNAIGQAIFFRDKDVLEKIKEKLL